MKRLFTIMTAVLLTASLFAQSPQKMSYQAVIRNSLDQLVTNHAVGMRISILQGSSSGIVVYTETQTPTTNVNGLVSIEIGGGAGFDAINWANYTFFIKTETDPLGGTTYTITGTSQLLSVPYALYAKRAGEHYVGELYGGGVVFWIDQTGSHGLICSMIDLSTAKAWSDVTATTVPAPGALSDWDGQTNTTAIVAQSTATSAADLCDAYINANYGTGTYSDWYLPSLGELNDLWNNLKTVQKALDSDENGTTTSLVKDNYWSSSEIGSNVAWYFAFYTGDPGTGYGKVNTYYVRAVRAF